MKPGTPSPPRSAGRSGATLVVLVGVVVAAALLLLLFVGPRGSPTLPVELPAAAPSPPVGERPAQAGAILPGADPQAQQQPGEAIARPLAPLSGTAAAERGPDAALLARVARDAATELERSWPTVQARCPVEGPDGGAFELTLAFDAEGREVSRGTGGIDMPSSARASCFLSLQDLRLHVPAPGMAVTVTVAAPRH